MVLNGKERLARVPCSVSTVFSTVFFVVVVVVLFFFVCLSIQSTVPLLNRSIYNLSTVLLLSVFIYCMISAAVSANKIKVLSYCHCRFIADV